MVKTWLALTAAVLAAALPGPAVQAAGGKEIAPRVRREAQRVLAELDRIEAAPGAPPGVLRTADVSESELNSYILYRLATEGDEVLKEMRFKLMADNRVEAMLRVDLSRYSLPVIFQPRMELYFAARLDARSGHARLDLEELFVGGQRVPVGLLDLLIATAAKLGLTDAGSVGDWYALPHGILEMRTAPGRLTLCYAP